MNDIKCYIVKNQNELYKVIEKCIKEENYGLIKMYGEKFSINPYSCRPYTEKEEDMVISTFNDTINLLQKKLLARYAYAVLNNDIEAQEKIKQIFEGESVEPLNTFSNKGNLIPRDFSYNKDRLMEYLDLLSKKNVKYYEYPPTKPHWLTKKNFAKPVSIIDINDAVDICHVSENEDTYLLAKDPNFELLLIGPQMGLNKTLQIIQNSELTNHLSYLINTKEKASANAEEKQENSKR